MKPIPSDVLGDGYSPQNHTDPCFVDISQTFATMFQTECNLDSPFIPELLSYFMPPKELQKEKHTFLFLFVDAFGMNQYERLDSNSFMKRYFKRKARAVFPSSTPCCMTSLLTGVYPSEHGCIGRVYLKDKKIIAQALQMTQFKTNTPLSVCFYCYYLLFFFIFIILILLFFIGKYE